MRRKPNKTGLNRQESESPTVCQDEYSLTPHETRILKLMIAGKSYKAIATTLGVSLNTVSFHIRHIYDKLDVHSKAEAVVKALRNNLV